MLLNMPNVNHRRLWVYTYPPQRTDAPSRHSFSTSHVPIFTWSKFRWEKKTRRRSTAKHRSVYVSARKCFWLWPLNPSTWTPNHGVRLPTIVSIRVSFCTGPFSGPWAVSSSQDFHGLHQKLMDFVTTVQQTWKLTANHGKRQNQRRTPKFTVSMNS